MCQKSCYLTSAERKRTIFFDVINSLSSVEIDMEKTSLFVPMAFFVALLLHILKKISPMLK
jgi:hypothetical protein